jgi:hypothetical protein
MASFVSVWAVQLLRQKQAMRLHVRNEHKRIPNTRVLSKEVLDHTKYEFYLPQMELSTARLIFVK